jgi:ADP-heptose:LPS heptosyltransferase
VEFFLATVKALVRRIIPGPIYHYGSQIYRGGLECALHLQMAMRFGVPETVLFFGIAPGDDLLCTAVLHELKKRGHGPLWMMSNYPELFAGNTDIARVVPFEDRFRIYAERWRAKYHLLKYAETDSEKDMIIPPTRHIIAELCLRAGVSGQIALRPYFHLTNPEKKKADWAEGMLAIQSSGLAAKFPMRNKQWYPERYQEVINQLKGHYKFIQLGSATDPLLAYATDLRGKTSIRETAAVLANCSLFIGNVGFLMHLARAVDCPSVIIYGGREAPWQSGYSCNLNIYSAVPCSPCWLWNKCDYNRICMENIAAIEVVNAIDEMMRHPHSMLPEDKITI